MEENINPIKEYGKKEPNMKILFIIAIVIMCCITVIFFISWQYKLAVSDTSEPSDIDLKNYSSLDEINYINGSRIPTLYKYTHYQIGSTAKYRYEDNRLGEKVTTIEISFSENIPEEYLNTYKEALNEEEYYYIANWEEDEVYAKPENGLNPQTGKIEPFNSFVIIGNSRVIYGVLLGDWERIFK